MVEDLFIGIDLGGTNIRAGLVNRHALLKKVSIKTKKDAGVVTILHDVFSLTDQLVHPHVRGIGIGVPGLVDTKQGIVYDVINIPSWQNVPLRKLMGGRYDIPVAINNDANCFALAEFYFGKGKESDSMLGLTIGTGLGCGIILNGQLYAGEHCGAGEFGMIDYLDRFYEYYASGQFFQNVYGLDGGIVYERASKGDASAIAMYEEMGAHLGNAVKTMLYALDVELIVLGGSVSKGFPYFSKKMWAQIRTIAFKSTAEKLRIEVSALDEPGILGAAALCY